MEKLADLKKDFSDAIAEREKQTEDFNNLLDVPISFDLHKIKITDIPDTVTQKQMESLLPLVEE